MQNPLLLISAIVAIIVSMLATIIPIGVANQWEVSAMFPTFITPATFTFSIWSVIYVSWVFLWVQVIRKKESVSLQNTLLFWLAQILSSFWLIPSQYLLITTSFIVMLMILCTLTYIFFHETKKSRFFTNTLQLFFGWILIACIANFHQVLVANDIYNHPVILTVISLVWAWWFVGYLLYEYHAQIIAGVYVWACIWIIMGQTSPVIVFTASLWAISMVCYMLLSYYFSTTQKSS